MRRITFVAPAVAVVLALTGCSAGANNPEPSDDGLDVTLASQFSTFDSAGFAQGLAAAVAVQNGESFGSEIEVFQSASAVSTQQGSTVALASFSNVLQDQDDVPATADEFNDALDEPAESTFDEQAISLDDASAALDDADLSVTLTQVVVEDVAVSLPVEGTSQVVVDLYIARELSSGVVWEEVVPYVSIVEHATGDVLAVEVHDDKWVLDHPAPSEPATLPPPLAPSQVSEISPMRKNTDSVDSNALAESFASLTATQRTAVGAYADKYWYNYNSAYLASPQDCTNFASQALFAGGWTKVLGLFNLDSAWWYTGGLVIKSYSWASAQNFYNFAIGSGRSTVLPRIYSLKVGNILQYDIGAAGMNHTMIVTKVVGTEPYLTYHTSNVHNKPFSVILPIIMGEDATPQWYALTT